MAPKKRRLGSWKEFLAYWEASRDVEESALGAIKALRASNAPCWDDVDSVWNTFGSYYAISLFLTDVLEDEFPELGEQIYKEVVDHFLEIAELRRDRHTDLPKYLWDDTSQRLLVFLGKNPPIPKLQKRVRSFLQAVTVFLHGEIDKKSLTRALLNYQMFDELKQLVKERVYDAIPPLFEAVVEQVGEENAHIILDIVRFGTQRLSLIGEAYLLVGSDSRVLRLLIKLSQACISGRGVPYTEFKDLSSRA